MTNKWKMLLSSAAVGALVASAPAIAADYNEWNTDNEAGITEEEWGAGFDETGAFDEWDEDDDGFLDEDEFTAGVFGGYDEDDDGILTEEEFGAYEEDEELFW